MKKYLPLILLGIGLLLVVGVFVFVRSRNKTSDEDIEEETALLEVDLKDRPVVSLIPSEDGHYLTLKLDKITFTAATVDYLLLYDTAADVQQGVPGTVQLAGLKSFEEKLLLGSESAGKFRYDDGVSTGSITLDFRNEEGKLLVKFMSDFHLQKASSNLSTQDESFKYQPEDAGENFFVSMPTVGYPGDSELDIDQGPFGIFASTNDKLPGKVEMKGSNVYRWNGGGWDKLNNGSSQNIGIFYSSSK